MTSILKVDTIQDTAGNNIINESGDTITIGASGDTITIPSGATLDVTSATVSGITSYANSDALTLFNASGSAPVYASRAWVNFQGTGTVAIRGSGNVTSITDNGTGDYSINFTTALSDANYSIVGCLREDTSGGVGNTTNRVLGLRRDTSTVTTTLIRVGVANFSGSATDAESVYIGIFR
jgi:hypothetical protein